MTGKFKQLQTVIRWALILQLIFAMAFFLYMILAGPMVIGIGKFDSVISKIESIDYRWWLLGFSFIFVIFSASMTFLSFIIDVSAIQLDQIREIVYGVLRDKKIPVHVDLDENIPINMDKPVEANFKVKTHLNIQQDVKIKADIPIKMNFPFNTTIDTKVLGIGKISIPIRTEVPVDMIFPFEGTVSMQVDNFELELNEKAQVELPPMEVPVKCSVDAELNLESNFKRVEETIASRRLK